MGYTHSFSQMASHEVNGKTVKNKALTRAAFKAFADEANLVARASKVPLAGWDGEDTLPEFSDKQVEFNGHADNGLETFRIIRRPNANDRNFTKTDLCAYDIVVVACLCLLEDHFPNRFAITTDGDVQDWEAGYRLAVAVTGRPLSLAVRFPPNPKNPEQHAAAIALEKEICTPIHLARARLERAQTRPYAEAPKTTPRRRPRT